jgi:hypothetical protein
MKTSQVEHDATRFVEDLRVELRAERLTILDCGFIRALQAGELSREQIGRWAKGYYALTRNGRLAIANLYANSPDDPDLRRELVANVYEEETGLLSGVGKCHMDVFFDFLAAFDVAPDEARALPVPDGAATAGTRSPATPIPVDGFYRYLSVYGLLGESPNAAFADTVYRVCRERYAFDEAQLKWFSMHAYLDADHGASLGRWFGRAALESGGLEQLRADAFALAPLYQAIWDGFGCWR